MDQEQRLLWSLIVTAEERARRTGPAAEEDRQMENFVTRDNICHYLHLLWSDNTSVEDRADINKLIIQGANKLSQDTPAIEFLENKTDSYRRRFGQICHWRDGFVDGSSERAEADRVLAKFETTLRAMEGCCIQMREELNRGRSILNRDSR
jgi:hypothetical protein